MSLKTEQVEIKILLSVTLCVTIADKTGFNFTLMGQEQADLTQFAQFMEQFSGAELVPIAAIPILEEWATNRGLKTRTTFIGSVFNPYKWILIMGYKMAKFGYKHTKLEEYLQNWKIEKKWKSETTIH